VALALLVPAAGLASQWLAWRIRLLAMVILIATDLILGPVIGIIELGMSQTELTALIGLSAAIILSKAAWISSQVNGGVSVMGLAA
jgi:hypothetical protein